MKRTEYECDRCGRRSNVKMPEFVCQFGYVGSKSHRGPNLSTGHLCRECEKSWTETFFNPIIEWIRDEEKK